MSSSGKLAEDGAGLKARFKRAVVSGGKHRGARYTDLAEAEIRRCATSYKGDPRFAQYCKQWVALHLLSPVEPSGADSSAAVPEKAGTAQGAASVTWSAWCGEKIKKLGSQVRSFARGRKLVAFCFFICFGILISRPSFGILFSKVTVLMIRGVLRRSIGLLTSVIDAVLDEAIEQVEAVLMGQPVQPTLQHQHAQPSEPVTQTMVPMIHDTWHWIAHIILVIGTFYRRAHGVAAD